MCNENARLDRRGLPCFKFDVDGVTYKETIKTARTKKQAEEAERRARRAGEVGPPENEDKLFRRRWLEVCARRRPDPDELVEFIKRKASRFIDWGDIGSMWKE